MADAEVDGTGASRAGSGPIRPMPEWVIWLGLGVVLLIGGASTWLLLSAFGNGSAQDKIRLESVKLAASIAVGSGGAAALVLAARRQRATELGVQQKEREQRLQEQKVADARHDADERRVTELYTAAAEQLGSDKAPVRMAGLYALERLGQNDPSHRQTIVNLLCSYLRMPFTHPDADPGSVSKESTPEGAGTMEECGSSKQQPILVDLAPSLVAATGLSLDGADYCQQEFQVRITAQRLLTKHLRPDYDNNGEPTNPDYWSQMDLDLTGAVLDRWNMTRCSVRQAFFTGAEFYGSALFRGPNTLMILM